MTSARYQASEQGKKLFFGMPNPLLIIEHLAATLSLEELQEIFYDTIDDYENGADLEELAPC